MKFKLTQDELCKAVEFYMNGSVLKEPVSVNSVKKDTDESSTRASVLHVVVETDTKQPVEHVAAA